MLARRPWGLQESPDAMVVWKRSILLRLIEFPSARPCLVAIVAMAGILGLAQRQAAGAYVNASPLDVRDFGGVGDGIADDWWAFQKAINAAAARPDGGVVIAPAPKPGGFWRLSHALRLYSGAIVKAPDPDTRFLCAGDAKGSDETGAREQSDWGFAGCFLLGAMFSPTLNLLPTLPIRAGKKGDQTVVLAESDNGQLTVGDLVTIENTARYFISPKPGSSFRPTEMQFQRIESFPAAGVVRLRYPLEASGGTVLRRLTNFAHKPGWPTLKVGFGKDSGIPIFASFRSGVIGGIWETARNAAAFISTGGALECVVKPRSVKAGFGVGYGNLFARCEMSADEESISQVPVELAFHSELNNLQLGAIKATDLKSGSAVPSWYIAIDESSQFNNVAVKSLVIEDSAPNADHAPNRFGSDAILISSSRCNLVVVDRIDGTPIDGSIVHIASPAYTGSAPASANNVVKIGQSDLSAQRRYALFDGKNTSGNTIMIAKVNGKLTIQPFKIGSDSKDNKFRLEDVTITPPVPNTATAYALPCGLVRPD